MGSWLGTVVIPNVCPRCQDLLNQQLLLIHMRLLYNQVRWQVRSDLLAGKSIVISLSLSADNIIACYKVAAHVLRLVSTLQYIQSRLLGSVVKYMHKQQRYRPLCTVTVYKQMQVHALRSLMCAATTAISSIKHTTNQAAQGTSHLVEVVSSQCTLVTPRQVLQNTCSCTQANSGIALLWDTSSH